MDYWKELEEKPVFNDPEEDKRIDREIRQKLAHSNNPQGADNLERLRKGAFPSDSGRWGEK